MPLCIALLRGINVVGKNMIPMAELRELFAKLGFANAQTLLQSGNVVFNAGKRSPKSLEPLLEKATTERFGVTVDYHVRTAEEWHSVVAENPFVAEAKRDPSHLVVLALRVAPTAKAVADLQAAIKGPELVRAVGRQAYLVYPIGIGPSKLANTTIDKHIGRGTARNWNTVMKLAAMLGD